MKSYIGLYLFLPLTCVHVGVFVMFRWWWWCCMLYIVMTSVPLPQQLVERCT